MCRYILLYNRCGCYGPLFTDDCCYRIIDQLHRIQQPEAWHGNATSELPFELPADCAPGWHNTGIEASGTSCQLLELCPSWMNPSWPYLYDPGNSLR